MKIIFYVCFIQILIYAIAQRPLITKEMYKFILDKNQWEPLPVEDNQFNTYDVTEAPKFMGLTSLMPNETLKELPSRLISNPKRQLNSYENFDGREKWPCINYVENQLECGASWAYAMTSVMSDRLCIKKETDKFTKLSVYSDHYLKIDLLTCDFLNYGCNGGTTVSALIHFVNQGITLDVCQKMRFNNIKLNCTRKCDNPRILYRLIKMDKNSISRMLSFKEIKDDIFEHGPVYAEMEIYEDLFHYKRGIYKTLTDNFLGYHSVRVTNF